MADIDGHTGLLMSEQIVTYANPRLSLLMVLLGGIIIGKLVIGTNSLYNNFVGLFTISV